MRTLRTPLAVIGASTILLSQIGFAANHREAPITALDHKADITDVYAFVSYGGANAGTHVTMIMWCRSAARAGQRTELVPFRSGHPVRDQGRQQQRRRRRRCVPVPFHDGATFAKPLPGVCRRRVWGIGSPPNSPPPVPPGTPIVPPQITSFSSAGLGQRQSYTGHNGERRGRESS